MAEEAERGDHGAAAGPEGDHLTLQHTSGKVMPQVEHVSVPFYCIFSLGHCHAAGEGRGQGRKRD